MEEFDQRYTYITDLIYKCDAQQAMLLQKIERVLHPYDNFMGKTEIIQNFERLREYTAEVEHKISNEWYNNVGLKKILRREFADLISQNRKDIEKILETLKE